MGFFTKDYVDFLQELVRNNDRDWFNANKKRYEKSVKEPFTVFVQTMIDRVQEKDASVVITPKDAMFRIYRDTRFSKDKTPYKTHMSAIISAGGRKHMIKPGIYIQFGAEDARIYSGAYQLDKNQLQGVREAIASDLKGFERLLKAKDFKEKFGEIHGDEHKRLPKEFQEAAKKQPLLYKKSFYFFAKFEPDVILKDNIADIMMEYYLAAQPLGRFFASAAEG